MTVQSGQYFGISQNGIVDRQYWTKIVFTSALQGALAGLFETTRWMYGSKQVSINVFFLDGIFFFFFHFTYW